MDQRQTGTGTRQRLDGVAALAADETRQARQARVLRERVMEPLAALRMDVSWMRAHLGDGPMLKGKLDEAVGLLSGALTAAQEVAVGLRPLALDDLGLAAALEGLFEHFGRERGIAWELDLDDRLALEQPRAMILYRIVQDWLHNLPADATHLRAGLAARPAEVVLTLGAASAPAKGEAGAPWCHVPQALRARVHLLQGSLSAQQEAEFESSLVVSIPLRAAPPG